MPKRATPDVCEGDAAEVKARVPCTSLFDALTPADVARCIRDGARVSDVDEGGWSPLMKAAVRDRWDVVDALIAHGATVVDVDAQGYSLVHLMCERRNARGLKKAIDRGAPVSHRALQWVLYDTPDDDAMVRLLMARGADANVRARFVCTPLLYEWARARPYLVTAALDAMPANERWRNWLRPDELLREVDMHAKGGAELAAALRAGTRWPPL